MKLIETQVILRKLVADDGKILTDGHVKTKTVCLAANETVERWQEVDEDEQ